LEKGSFFDTFNSMKRVTSLNRAATTRGHYVYLYRDNRERVRYVGYGKTHWRASSHLTGSHNGQMSRFLKAREYRIEIAGPFETETTGRAIETALISALKPNLNVSQGEDRWRFRPLGVPEEFATRQVKPELCLGDFLTAQGVTPRPVLFVIINDVNFEGSDDNRIGYNPVKPPTDKQIRLRVDGWWQLQWLIPKWALEPATSPGLLVGVFGSPGRQTVIASARIDQKAWEGVKPIKGGKIRVPLVEPADLDAFLLRGRRIAFEAGLKFGNFDSQLYILLGTNGVAAGGHPRRK
jgi:hypothetical protein